MDAGYVTEEVPFFFGGFEDIERDSERFHWSINQSKGVALLSENDWGAKEDYLERCASIATEPPGPGS